MNASQVGGVLRIVVVAAIAIFGTLGYTADINWEPIISLVVGGGMVWWSHHVNSTPSMVATVANSPDVKQVVMATPELANATTTLADQPKVVGPSGAMR